MNRKKLRFGTKISIGNIHLSALSKFVRFGVIMGGPVKIYREQFWSNLSNLLKLNQLNGKGSVIDIIDELLTEFLQKKHFSMAFLFVDVGPPNNSISGPNCTCIANEAYIRSVIEED